MRLNEISWYPKCSHDRVDILVNGLLVECIGLRGLGHAAIRADLVGDLVELRLGATNEECSGLVGQRHEPPLVARSGKAESEWRASAW